jgi:hypothetical protein
MAFRAAAADGRVLNSLTYPQYYNDQFSAANGLALPSQASPIL